MYVSGPAESLLRAAAGQAFSGDACFGCVAACGGCCCCRVECASVQHGGAAVAAVLYHGPNRALLQIVLPRHALTLICFVSASSHVLLHCCTADCPPGSFAVGWGCHICPEGSYKDTFGPARCTPCSTGLITSQGAAMAGRVLSAHDEAADCRIGERLGWQVLIALACSGFALAAASSTLNTTNITCYVT